MDFIQLQNSSQVSFGRLEDHIGPDNPVRLIVAFGERFADLRWAGFIPLHFIRSTELSVTTKLSVEH